MKHVEGVFIYTDPGLRKALRARAYQSGRSMSDIARDALFEVLTVPIPKSCVLGFTVKRPQHIIAAISNRYVFAWGPTMFDRVWAPDVSDASNADYGVVWCGSVEEACARAREHFRALGQQGGAEEWAQAERAFLSQVSHAGPPKRQKEDSAHAV